MNITLIIDGESFDLSNVSDAHCFAKAIKRGQTTFTVVEQDLTAAATVAFWLSINQATIRAVKEQQAMAIIEKLSNSTIDKKWPD